MTDRTWRGDRSHFAPRILGAYHSGQGSIANVPSEELPHLPVTCFELNGASYEVHSVEGRLEVVQRPLPDLPLPIGYIVKDEDEYRAVYPRSVWNMLPLVFTFEDRATAINWIIEQAEKEAADRLERGWKRLKAEIEAENENNNRDAL